MSKQSRSYKYSIKHQEKSIWIWLPLMIIFLFLPSISYLHIYEPGLNEYSWFTDEATAADLFLHCKSVVLNVMSVLMVVQIVYSIVKKGKPMMPKAFILLAVYAALSLLSSALSEYRSFSFGGIYEQFESVWVLLGYCIVTFYAYYMLQTERELKILMYVLLGGIGFSVLIGLSQAFGYNFWSTELGMMLRIPNADLRENIEVNATMGDVVYMSLYNPNYVGMYAALLTPVIVLLLVPEKNRSKIIDKKEIIKKIGWITGLVLLIFGLIYCTFKSGSKNGFLSLAIAFVFLILILAIRYRRYWYLSLIALIVLAGAFFAADRLMGQRITVALKDAFRSQKVEKEIKDIILAEDCVDIYVNDDVLRLQIDAMSNSVKYFDGDGMLLNMEQSAGEAYYVIKDDRFSMFRISFVFDGEAICPAITYQGMQWCFRNKNGQVECTSPTGKWCTFESAPSAVFTGRESIFTNRGYIWSRTIPLLKDYLLLGSGADTFLLVFPNDDYVGKMNHGYYNTLISKPHSMYLQIAVQTGMLSLIAMLTFYGVYFIMSCRVYLTHQMNSFVAKTGLGIFAGTVGYMVSGLTNDSTVAVAPLFWGLLGLGFAINTKLLKEEKKIS